MKVEREYGGEEIVLTGCNGPVWSDVDVPCFLDSSFGSTILIS